MSVKDMILQAGLTLLKEKGVAALTQPQVAAAAGYKQSHLTYYFPTRNDLLLAIADYSIEKILSELAACLAEPAQPQNYTERICKNLIEGLPPRVIIGLIVAADQDPAIHHGISHLVGQVRSKIQQLMAQAGLAHEDQDALLFHATLVGLAVMHQGRMNELSEQEIVIGVNALVRRFSLPTIN